MNDSHDIDPQDDFQRPKFTPLTAQTRIRQENGRWVVYLNIPTWEPDGEQHPIQNNWRQINDYATEREALVAASWYERSANRTHRPPTGF